MDETEVRRLIADSWARFADEVRPGSWDDLDRAQRDSQDAVANAAEAAAKAVGGRHFFGDAS